MYKILTVFAVCLISSLPSFGRVGDTLSVAPVVAFRTNLLVPLMNAGVEVPVSDNISLEAEFCSPWIPREWLNRLLPANKCCFQFVGGSIGCRYWFGGSGACIKVGRCYGLCGHSVGFIASGGIYDIGWDWKGQQGEFAFIGVDYLYAVPVGNGGVHFEFNAGVGYGVNLYHDYDVHYEGGRLMGSGERRIRHLPVPVRLGISLIVPVFKRVKTENEGGPENGC